MHREIAEVPREGSHRGTQRGLPPRYPERVPKDGAYYINLKEEVPTIKRRCYIYIYVIYIYQEEAPTIKRRCRL
jgi:hypothetical protein